MVRRSKGRWWDGSLIPALRYPGLLPRGVACLEPLVEARAVCRPPSRGCIRALGEPVASRGGESKIFCSRCGESLIALLRKWLGAPLASHGEAGCKRENSRRKVGAMSVQRLGRMDTCREEWWVASSVIPDWAGAPQLIASAPVSCEHTCQEGRGLHPSR